MSFKVKDLDEMRREKEARSKDKKTTKDIPEVKSELGGKVINIDRLNVRKKPEGDVISVILRNSQIRVLEDPGESWLKIVTPSGLEGWVMRQFIETFEVSIGG